MTTEKRTVMEVYERPNMNLLVMEAEQGFAGSGDGQVSSWQNMGEVSDAVEL